MYDEKIIERFQNPIFVGEIENADGVGQVGNMKCGDIMKIFIKVNKETDTIEDIKFKTYGCVAAIASSDHLCELAKGKTLDDAEKITAKDVIEHMGGEIPDSKKHCSILAHEALVEAIKDYRNK